MSLMATVSGIRGIVGTTLTPQRAATAGCAMAAYAKGGRVVVGRDSRTSGEMIRSAVMSGLLAGGCEVIDLGIVTTPTTAVMVRELEASGGMIITASHNPAPWNGIKFLTAEGAAPPRHVAEKILARFTEESLALVAAERIRGVTLDDSATERHLRLVTALVDVERIRARRFRVVLDSVNGAGGAAGRQLLEHLRCQLVHMYAEPTGRFAHPPEPLRENLVELCERTRTESADIGFAQDPDADRLAIVDETGRYIGEECTLALVAKLTFATRPGPACTNLSTSRMIDDLAAQAGGACTVQRSAVGEANVVELMRQTDCVIGGEGNGGVIEPRVVYVRDSLSAMALTLQLLAQEGRSLSAVVDSLPRYTMIKQKIKYDPSERTTLAKAIDALISRFGDARISTIDGVRIDWPQGWVHVRASNTEPLVRVIAEAADEATAEDLVARVRSTAGL